MIWTWRKNYVALIQAIESKKADEVARALSLIAPVKSVHGRSDTDCLVESPLNTLAKKGWAAVCSIPRRCLNHFSPTIRYPRTLNAMDKYGVTPLSRAISEKCGLEIIQLLVAAGCPVNERYAAAAGSVRRLTPLMSAVVYGDINTVRYLLSQGADVNIQDDRGKTALAWAVYREVEWGVVQLLVASGADVNKAEVDGTTNLMRAATQGNRGLVRFLIEAGADITTRDSLGRTALMWVLVGREYNCQRADLAIVIYMTGSPPFCPPQPLPFSATQKGAFDELLSKGSDIRALDNHGHTMLMLAAYGRMPGAVQAVLVAGSDRDEIDEDGYTALMMAAVRGNADAVRALIEASAPIGFVGMHGVALGATAESLAIANGETECHSILRSARERLELRSAVDLACPEDREEQLLPRRRRL